MSAATTLSCHSILGEVATDSVCTGVFGYCSVSFLYLLLVYNNE
jgi:hypothetical protein